MDKTGEPEFLFFKFGKKNFFTKFKDQNQRKKFEYSQKQIFQFWYGSIPKYSVLGTSVDHVNFCNKIKNYFITLFLEVKRAVPNYLRI